MHNYHSAHIVMVYNSVQYVPIHSMYLPYFIMVILFFLNYTAHFVYSPLNSYLYWILNYTADFVYSPPELVFVLDFKYVLF